MKIRQWIIGSCLALVSLAAPAQSIMEVYDKPCSFSVRVGFNSSFPVIHSFMLDDQAIDHFRLHYKVGYMASVLCSINMNRFFIQPAVNWERSSSEIQFAWPQTEEIYPSGSISVYDHKIDAEYNSIAVPVLVGYHLVKEGPYGLNFKLGPKGVYHYKKQQSGSGPQAIITHQDDNINYAVDLVTAVGVTIGRLFLDFSYEFELHKTQSTYTYQSLTQNQAGILSIQQRRNALSFSLGLNF